MDFSRIIALSFGAAFLNNFVFSRFLGVYPAFAGFKRPGPAALLGAAVTVLMTAASAACYPVYTYLLIPYNLDKFLATPFFVLICYILTEAADLTARSLVPAFYKKLGGYMPLITANSAVLGTALLIVHEKYDYLTGIIFGIVSGIGFIVSMVIMAGIGERLERSKVPAAFRGLPALFLSASLAALAFSGLSGIFK